MFSNDKNIDRIARFLSMIRKYGELRWKGARVELVCRIGIFLSSLILGAIVFILSCFLLLFLSFTATYFLASRVGGLLPACGIVALGYLCLIVLVYANRRRWIVDPTVNFLTHLFLDDSLRQREVSPAAQPPVQGQAAASDATASASSSESHFF